MFFRYSVTPPHPTAKPSWGWLRVVVRKLRLVLFDLDRTGNKVTAKAKACWRGCRTASRTENRKDAFRKPAPSEENDGEFRNKKTPTHTVPLASARHHPENQKENQAGHADPLRIRGEDCGTAAAPVRHRRGTGAEPVRVACGTGAERVRNGCGTPTERVRNAGGSAARGVLWPGWTPRRKKKAPLGIRLKPTIRPSEIRSFLH